MEITPEETQRSRQGRVDRTDITYAFVVGLVFAGLKPLSRCFPAWEANRLVDIGPFLLTVGYIVYRARREPVKLDEWGLTSPIGPMAIVSFMVFLAVGAGMLAACGHALEGSLSFSPSYITAMVRYFPSGFTQQFYLCSVGLVSLAKLPALRGPWRLPLLLSLVFGVAHYFGPSLVIPGTAIPLHIIGTMPLGFMAAYYFLRFRNVVPLSICHAVFYVLMNRWIETSLT